MANIVDFSHSRAERLYRDGVLHEERGRFDEALRVFQQVVQLNPSHVEAHISLAFGYHRNEQYEEALHHARIAVSLKPSARAHFALGHALLSRRDTLAALDEFRACLTFDPDFADARYQIAFAYYLQGDYDVAITEFHRVALRNPDWETFFFMGECYRLTMRSAEAERTFRKALAIAGNWTQVELTRGQLDAALRLGEFPDGHIFTMKDRLYCDTGTIYLGTTRDDGVRIPPYLIHHFNYEDIARTLQRFRHLKKSQGWTWDTIWAVDDTSLPLAMAMASLFNLKVQAPNGARPLVVQAIGENVTTFQETVAEVKSVNSFCLLTCWAEEWHADITGVVTPLVGSVPWHRKNQKEGVPAETLVDSRPPDQIAHDILTTLKMLPAEPNLTAQLDYYHRHHRLRWDS